MTPSVDTSVVLMHLQRWIDTTERQLRRADQAAAASCAFDEEHASVVANAHSDNPEQAPVLFAMLEVMAVLRDEVHFLLIAAHHAVETAPRRATAAGLDDVPKCSTREDVGLLRNIVEHWDAPAKLAWAPSTDPDPPWHDRRLSAGRRLKEKYGRTGMPGSLQYGRDGLIKIGGVLSMSDLREDLRSLRAYVHATRPSGDQGGLQCAFGSPGH